MVSQGAYGRRSNLKLTKEQLLEINVPILVKGHPGAGKTTLLRKLTQMVNANLDCVAILIRLVKVKDLDIDGLVEACLHDLRSNGYPVASGYSTDSFIADLHIGKYILLFDGLDETGHRIDVAVEGLQSLLGRKLCRPSIITCRSAIQPKWDGVLTIDLLPFADHQVRKFVANWFKGEENSVEEICEWLDRSPKMKEQARTPLILALLCSLYEADAELPDTEVGLYERRLQLLVGQWESAKGITPLSRTMQSLYKHYLMQMAVQLHRSEARSIPREEFLDGLKNYNFTKQGMGREEVLDDLIQRDLVVVEPEGLSLGHLTFQEFLVARWLAEENDIESVLRHIEDDWWIKVVSFYAAIRRDVSALLRAAIAVGVSAEAYSRLHQLAANAPMTSMTSKLDLNRKMNSMRRARRGT